MDKKKWFLLIAVILYIVSPVDFLPGPVDDAIVALLYAATQSRRLIKEQSSS